MCCLYGRKKRNDRKRDELRNLRDTALDEDASSANLCVRVYSDLSDGDVSNSHSRYDGEVEENAISLEEDINSDFDDGRSSADW
jgi:hypothetical protein